MRRKLKHWYEGERQYFQNEPGSSVVFFSWEDKRHWTSRATRVLVEFYLREWKWCWGVIISLVGYYIASKRMG